jgi:hypothetical protein
VRLPADAYAAAPAEDAPEPDRQAFRAAREVRHTVIRVITAHLQPDHRRAAAQDWRGLDLDFTDAIFDGGEFTAAQFIKGKISFRGAQFFGEVDFSAATFSGGMVDFSVAKFSGGTVGFSRVMDWAVPPLLPDWDEAPAGVLLPVSQSPKPG